MSILGFGQNISSLSAQRRLHENSNALSKTYERLSSGMRINSAGDDAAGLSLSESLKSDVRIFLQGVRNLNDGISLLNIADSAVESLTDIVVRLNELAEQAANGAYSNTQRQALDKEAQSLSKEYSRIAQSTKFNDKSLFSSSFGALSLQAGYGENSTISSGLGGVIGTGTVASSVTVAGTATNYALGDINGDGIIDMLVHGSSGNVGVRLGAGSGSFGDVISYSSGFVSISEVALEDLNGDGILDMVAGTNNGLSIRFGNGDGTFSEAQTYSGIGAVNFAAGDINGNGLQDLITGRDAGGHTVYYIGLNNGDGTYNFASTFSMSYLSVGKISLEDLDNDGALDMVISGYLGAGGAISIRKGNGDGTFQTASSFMAGDVFDFAIGDINNDGILDIAAAEISGSSRVFLGKGDGTFTSGTSLSFTDAKVALGDVNGDGNLDLMSVQSSLLRIQYGNGDGTFSSATTYNNLFYAGSHTASYNILLADINGNGVLDIFGSTPTGSSATIAFINTAEGVGPLLPFSLKTMADARQALPVFSKKLEQLSSQRGKIGAFQSRVEVATSNLQGMADNYSVAASRITDADIAEETSRLIRLQILQESSVAVLAQANLQPSLALKLLSVE